MLALLFKLLIHKKRIIYKINNYLIHLKQLFFVNKQQCVFTGKEKLGFCDLKRLYISKNKKYKNELIHNIFI